MRNQPTVPLVYASNRGAICVADGYHISVRVRHGRLIIEDGFADERRRREYTRVTEPISRLVIVGNAGSVSLEALCWLRDAGAAMLHVTRDGRLVATTMHEVADAKLRRAQALALSNGVALEIARALLQTKLDGQGEVLGDLATSDQVSASFSDASTRLDTATSIDELVWAERDAALAYWSAWSAVKVSFAASDQKKVPQHWSRLAQRGSPLSTGSRLAINPANAILNYLYALLEAESRLALLAVGLDPAIGIVHVDYRSRDSFALDLMETVRPEVDAYLLRLLRTRTFRARDFTETRTGVCRITTRLARELGETLGLWRQLLAPRAEELPRFLESRPRANRLSSTPLTRTNRRAAHKPRRISTSVASRPAPPIRTCKRCGGDLPHQRRVYCDVCLPVFLQEQRESAAVYPIPRPRHPSPKSTSLPADDATHGGKARERRAAANIARKAAARDWDERHGKLVDLSSFDREILPLIQSVSLSRLRRATGLSLRYVSQIRRGEKRPHPRHWKALLAAVDTEAR